MTRSTRLSRAAIEPYLLERRFAASASKEAAAATAAHRVLSSIVSTVPSSIPFPNRASLLATLEAEYAASLAAIPDRLSKTQGIAAGNAAADAMIAARLGDGRFGQSPWVPSEEPGHWQPQLGPDETQMLDPTPWVADVRPFLIESSSQFRTEGPLALTSDSVGGRVQRGRSAARRTALTARRAGAQCALVAEHGRANPALESRPRGVWSKAQTESTSVTARSCSPS